MKDTRRLLPVVEFDNKEFFVDIDNREFRDVNDADNPFHFLEHYEGADFGPKVC